MPMPFQSMYTRNPVYSKNPPEKSERGARVFAIVYSHWEIKYAFACWFVLFSTLISIDCNYFDSDTQRDIKWAKNAREWDAKFLAIPKLWKQLKKRRVGTFCYSGISFMVDHILHRIHFLRANGRNKQMQWMCLLRWSGGHVLCQCATFGRFPPHSLVDTFNITLLWRERKN